MTHRSIKNQTPQHVWDIRTKKAICDQLLPVNTLHENPWFALKNRGGYFTIEYHLAQVVILPIVDHNSIVMLRVKRPVLGDNPLELPAGAIEEGETPEAGAARELAEEAGIVIQDLQRFQPMPPLAVSPNRNPKLSYIYKVHLSKEEFSQRNQHDDEILQVELYTVEEVKKMICKGEIYISIPIAVISNYLFSQAFTE